MAHLLLLIICNLFDIPCSPLLESEDSVVHFKEIHQLLGFGRFRVRIRPIHRHSGPDTFRHSLDRGWRLLLSVALTQVLNKAMLIETFKRTGEAECAGSWAASRCYLARIEGFAKGARERARFMFLSGIHNVLNAVSFLVVSRARVCIKNHAIFRWASTSKDLGVPSWLYQVLFDVVVSGAHISFLSANEFT